MKRVLLGIFVIATIAACGKKAVPGTLEVESDVIYLPADEGIRHILVDATTEWRLEYDTSTPWMSTDLHGGKAARKYFTVSYLENPNASVRTCTIKIFTSDRNDVKELTLIQRRQASAIHFSVEEFEAECWAGSYSVAFTDNIIDRSNMTVSTDSDWITLYPFTADTNAVEFYLDRIPSVVTGSRVGHIYVSCEVEDEGTVTGALTVRQFAKTN